MLFNSLPHDKNSAWCKSKAFAGNKLDVVKMIIFLIERLENKVFPKPSSLGSLKVGIVW